MSEDDDVPYGGSVRRSSHSRKGVASRVVHDDDDEEEEEEEELSDNGSLLARASSNSSSSSSSSARQQQNQVEHQWMPPLTNSFNPTLIPASPLSGCLARCGRRRWWFSGRGRRFLGISVGACGEGY